MIAPMPVVRRILGIDPGLRVTGFGVLELRGTVLVYITSGCIRATGTWSTAYVAAYSNGTSRWTTQPGATLRTVVHGGAVGLVLDRAPDRGDVDVYVDGGSSKAKCSVRQGRNISSIRFRLSPRWAINPNYEKINLHSGQRSASRSVRAKNRNRCASSAG